MITRFSPALFSFPPTISHPPCLLLAPTPVREHSGMGGIDGIDGIHFAPRIFSLTLSPTLSPFFYFLAGKYGNYAIYGSGVCFELKFDRRVKNQSVPESMARGIQSMPLLPPQCVRMAVRTRSERVQKVLWHRLVA